MIDVAGPHHKSWFSREEMAAMLGLSVQRIDQLRTQFNKAAEKRDRNTRRVLLHAPEWLNLWKGAGKSETPGESEFFGTTDAEWQDKCWEERFYALRDERFKRHDQLIMRNDVHEVFAIAAGQIRQLGEKLQKRFGPDAQDDVNDCLENIQQRAESILADDSASNGHAAHNGVAESPPERTGLVQKPSRSAKAPDKARVRKAGDSNSRGSARGK